MIKQIWTVRSLLKLLNGLAVSFSAVILGYTILNLLVLEQNVPIKTFLLFGNTQNLSKFLLLIIPIIGLGISVFLFILANKPKTIKYEINEVTKPVAIADLKNHRELVIGLNLLYSAAIGFAQVDVLSFAKQIDGFIFVPSIAFIVLSIPFIIVKMVKTHKIYEI